MLSFDRLGGRHGRAAAVFAFLGPIEPSRICGGHIGSSHFQIPFLYAAAGLSSLSAPFATIINPSSGNGLCSALASFHGARIQTLRSSSVARITVHIRPAPQAGAMVYREALRQRRRPWTVGSPSNSRDEDQRLCWQGDLEGGRARRQAKPGDRCRSSCRFMPPAELCRTGPVWRVVVTLASSIACTAAPCHSASSGRSERLQEGEQAVVPGSGFACRARTA
jgi:hypothetical protein